jgi:spore maturation protein SpmB
LLIVAGGVYKKINVFDAFVEGAKGGFETAVKIIPYFVGMLVAISLLSTSGTFDVIIDGIKHLFAAIGFDTKFVDGLPTALIKPMSGSGARGMMIDTMRTLDQILLLVDWLVFYKVVAILLLCCCCLFWSCRS